MQEEIINVKNGLSKSEKHLVTPEPYNNTQKFPILFSRFHFELMPDVVLGKIISYLHWKEREWFVCAVPSAQRVMNSPLAWENFENDRCYGVEILQIYFPILVQNELSVIRNYGQYFQSCTIWSHKVLYMDEERNSDFHLLKAVAENCRHLKTLCLMHFPDVTLSKIKFSFEFYLQPILCLASRNPFSFKLSINRLFYSSINTVQTGIKEYMLYLHENELSKFLVCLDFSHGLVLDCSSHQNVLDLLKCTNLQTLKCPIQSVDTSIILSLSKKKLMNLYLVNDDYTQNSGFYEKLFLDWQKIRKDLPESKKEIFNVHYIFKNRAMCHEDLHPNPFLKSLIFDNLSSNISAKLLHNIADLYGATLQNLAFCSHYWEFLMHFSDLGKINESFKYLGKNCVQLKSFLSCLSLPSSALVSLVKTSRKMSTVQVFKENISLAPSDKPEGVFKHKMAQELGIPHWDMIKKGANIFKIPNADCRLLFANCFNEF